MRVYLAGWEQASCAYQVDIPKHQNVFCTYFYQNLADKTLLRMKEIGHKGLITIDSGAHSFFEIMGISVTGHSFKDDKKKLPSPYEYFEAYLQWIKKWYHHFDYFVELDVQELVGQKQILEWRERFKEAGVYDKCITVWHSYNSMADFDHMLSDSKSRYVAIEGIRKGKKMLDYNLFIKECYRRQVRIHGFALTRSDLLTNCPFYSVDSSSWTAGPRYGSIHIFDKREGRIKTAKSTPKHFFKFNLPVTLTSDMRGKVYDKAKLEFNANSYLEMEEYFTKLWTSRGIVWKD